MSRSRILLAVLRDIPLKRKKSTGGLFLGADQFIIELLHLVTGFVTDGGMLVVLGTEWIFFGLPTVKEKVTERSYTQNELTSQRKNEIIHRPKHFGETQYLCHLLQPGVLRHIH